MSNILVWLEFEHMNLVFAAGQGFSEDVLWLKYTEVMIKQSAKIVHPAFTLLWVLQHLWLLCMKTHKNGCYHVFASDKSCRRPGWHFILSALPVGIKKKTPQHKKSSNNELDYSSKQICAVCALVESMGAAFIQSHLQHCIRTKGKLCSLCSSWLTTGSNPSRKLHYLSALAVLWRIRLNAKFVWPLFEKTLHAFRSSMCTL